MLLWKNSGVWSLGFMECSPPLSVGFFTQHTMVWRNSVNILAQPTM